ncbi:MAG: T9SS type A sorting domain-containing protein, partial [Chlorobium sp.]|nr:T9SS type A sorting domain-containing protein [Chlorobium sp.]
SPWLNSIYILNDFTGWAVGEGRAILKTTNGGVTFIEDENNNFSQPVDYLLEQNYPNPFNPSTKIKYTVPIVIASVAKQSQLINLKVYDILGREVAVLVNEQKPAGTYEVEFDGKGLPSGIYFYQLRAGNFVETKKMVLMK